MRVLQCLTGVSFVDPLLFRTRGTSAIELSSPIFLDELPTLHRAQFCKAKDTRKSGRFERRTSVVARFVISINMKISEHRQGSETIRGLNGTFDHGTVIDF